MCHVGFENLKSCWFLLKTNRSQLNKAIPELPDIFVEPLQCVLGDVSEGHLKTCSVHKLAPIKCCFCRNSAQSSEALPQFYVSRRRRSGGNFEIDMVVRASGGKKTLTLLKAIRRVSAPQFIQYR